MFITPHAFNKVTGTGITFTNLFHDWPKDRIATVHDDDLAVTTDVCDTYYRLGGDEIRKFGGALTNRPASHPGPASGAGKSASGLLQGIKKIVFGDGLPQRGILSPGLEAWIKVFRPDVIYTILGSNGLMDVVEAVHRRFGVPLVVHIMDDWMAGAFSSGLLGPMQRRRMLRSLRRIIEKSSLRLGICDAMCEAYSERYGVPFRAFQNVVDTKTVARYTTDPAASGDPVRIVYAGSVFAYAQRQSLIDCCLAINQLAGDGVSVQLDIHCPRPHIAGAEHLFAVGSAINLHGPLTDNADFFSTICAADILLIPVNFDRKSAAFIRYSMPTRVPAYLASGTPILVYGPPDVAQVKYADDFSWAYVVHKPDAGTLNRAIIRLIYDIDLRSKLSKTAQELACQRHDAGEIRRQFHESLSATAKTQT